MFEFLYDEETGAWCKPSHRRKSSIPASAGGDDGGLAPTARGDTRKAGVLHTGATGQPVVIPGKPSLPSMKGASSNSGRREARSNRAATLSNRSSGQPPGKRWRRKETGGAVLRTNQIATVEGER